MILEEGILAPKGSNNGCKFRCIGAGCWLTNIFSMILDRCILRYCDRHKTIIKYSFIQSSDALEEPLRERGKNIRKILSNIRASDVIRKISGYPG